MGSLLLNLCVYMYIISICGWSEEQKQASLCRPADAAAAFQQLCLVLSSGLPVYFFVLYC